MTGGATISPVTSLSVPPGPLTVRRFGAWLQTNQIDTETEFSHTRIIARIMDTPAKSDRVKIGMYTCYGILIVYDVHLYVIKLKNKIIPMNAQANFK